jgi:signal peptidase II
VILKNSRRLPWLLGVAALIIFLDRFTKSWVVKHIPFGGRIPVISNALALSHWTNDGAAFSLFADSASPHTVRWILILFTLAVAVGILVAMVRIGDRFTLTSIALALVFAGALGNVHDRIAYGSVVDFIEVHIFSYHWPDFNIADSSIVTGACLLVLDSLLPKKSTLIEETLKQTE